MFRTRQFIVVDLVADTEQSDFILTASDTESVHGDGNYGEIRVYEPGLMICFFLAPMDPLKKSLTWEIMVGSASGYIFVLDALRPETFADITSSFQELHAMVIAPTIVLVSGTNGAPNTFKAIRQALKLPADIDLFPYIPFDRPLARQAVDALMAKVRATDI